MYKLLTHEKLKHVFFFFSFVPPDFNKGNSGRKMMYYLKDGVYGSLSCILNNAAQVKPYRHRVNIVLLLLEDNQSQSVPKSPK